MDRQEAGAARSSTWRFWLVLLATWTTANGLTHVLTYGLFGKIYYQFGPAGSTLCEASINLLNLFLPLVALRLLPEWRQRPVGEALAIHFRRGWPLLWGVGGFVTLMAVSVGLNSLFNNQIIGYSPSASRNYTAEELRWVVLMLLFLPALGEEVMFRGFLQTSITQRYGGALGILVPALLFALRHHPADIYFGVLNNVPLAGWANRFLQLYVGAVIFGLVRHFGRSLWASYLMHLLLILTILVFGGLLRYLLP